MKKLMIVAMLIASPAAAEFHAENAMAIDTCRMVIQGSLPHPKSTGWLGHEVYTVVDDGKERFVRFGYRYRDESGKPFTQTSDCRINPLPDGWERIHQ